MKQRLAYANAAPDGVKALCGLQLYIEACGPDQQMLELVDLSMASVATNGWNRLGVAFRPPVSHCLPLITEKS